MRYSHSEMCACEFSLPLRLHCEDCRQVLNSITLDDETEGDTA